jgi:phage I-like protein
LESVKITASFNEPITLSTKIMYIPEGEHSITPSVDGKPGAIVSKVSPERGDAIVGALNNSLKKRHSKNVRPFIDFDHNETGPAAAIPVSFSYEIGAGIMLELEWTASGTSAIEGKDYSYFSPLYSMSRSTGEPVGLEKDGAIGALVNGPAFTTIKRIAANKSQPTTNTPEMDINVLVKAGLVTEAESQTDKVAEITAANIKSIKVEAAKVAGLEAEVVELKAAAVKGAEITADRAIEAAVNTGRIAAKDEVSKDFWREQLIEASSNEEKLTKVSAALESIKPVENLLKREVVVAAAKKEDSQSRQSALLVKAKNDLGDKSSFLERFNHAQVEDPSAFQD